MKRFKKIVKWSLGVLAVAVLGLVVTVSVRADRKFDAPYPEVRASNDPAVIERGRYLAYGPAHCVNCHTGKEQEEAVRAGATPPLTGGHRFDLPFGTLYTPNLTPDRATGIARYTDRELARVIRHGVLPSGRMALPFMEFQHLSDEDLVALISFLRSQSPVRNEVPRHKFNFLGKTLLAFLMKPVGPSRPILAVTPPEGTLERGEYVATSVANCASCHTKRNMLTGAYVVEKFAGGMEFEIPGNEETKIVSPNLTPSRTGRITEWSEEQFVGRFGAGVGIPHTHMPWKQFQSMSEADLRAIYRYLKTLPPIDHDPGPTLQRKGVRS